MSAADTIAVDLADVRDALALGQPEEAFRLVHRVLARAPKDREAQTLENRCRLALGLPGWTEDDEADLSRRFCNWPFRRLETRPNGTLFTCCGGWIATPFAHMDDGPVEVIWNSETIQAIRASILDGSFSYCSRARCNLILNRMLPYREDVTDPAEREILERGTTVLDHRPREVRLSHDRSCNLECPSCRTELIHAKGAERRRLAEAVDAVVLPLLRDAEVVEITGSGDAFGSQHFRQILAAINADDFPGLKIDLYTNGVLFDEQAWKDLGLAGLCREAIISVDATTPETHAELRKGGDFARLLRNFEFIAELRRSGELSLVNLIFVVQERNFREIPDFVRLVKRFGFDNACFQMIAPWKETIDFDAKNVGSPDHPRHAEFLEILRDPILEDPVAFLGTMRRAWEQATGKRRDG